jgi:hypothetical protein
VTKNWSGTKEGQTLTLVGDGWNPIYGREEAFFVLNENNVGQLALQACGPDVYTLAEGRSYAQQIPPGKLEATVGTPFQIMILSAVALVLLVLVLEKSRN